MFEKTLRQSGCIKLSLTVFEITRNKFLPENICERETSIFVTKGEYRHDVSNDQMANKVFTSICVPASLDDECGLTSSVSNLVL